MNKNTDIKIVVAMSGGVDSSVSAAILKEAGFNVIGAFMRCWSASSASRHTRRDGSASDSPAGECTAEEDEHWARRAAQHIGIPFYSFNLVNEYKQRVVDYFVSEYGAGRTPNPDVMCNSEIKFGVFFDKVVKEVGADYVATGHYARLRREFPISNFQFPNKSQISSSKNQTVRLLKGIDTNKDQSYFLYRVPQEKLARTMFPVGEYTKPQVRELARKFGLPNAEKKDSQGICFIGKVDVREFLKAYLPQNLGAVVSTAGEKVGQHAGAHYFTIGQRRGMGIGGGVPYYVVDKDVETNTVVVGTGYDEGLYSKKAVLEDVVWVGEEPKEGVAYKASIRYRQTPQNVSVERKSGHFVLRFIEPQRAVTPGQSVVIYDSDAVLGGGIVA